MKHVALMEKEDPIFVSLSLGMRRALRTHDEEKFQVAKRIIYSISIIVDGEEYIDHNVVTKRKFNPHKHCMRIITKILAQYPNKDIVLYYDYDNMNHQFLHFVLEQSQLDLKFEEELDNNQLDIVERCRRIVQDDLRNMQHEYTKTIQYINEQKDYQQQRFSQLDKYVNNINTIYVATDATSFTDMKKGFAACVSEHGDTHVTMINNDDNNEAEAAAIRLAIAIYAQNNTHLIIQTDSQCVIDAIQYTTITSSVNEQMGLMIDAYREKNTGTCFITLEKVKAHNGHVLNEAADRAAFYGRLHYEGIYTDEEYLNVLDNLKDNVVNDIVPDEVQNRSRKNSYIKRLEEKPA